MKNDLIIKIEVLLKDNNNSINRLEFNNCELKFIGNYIVICEIDEKNNKLCQIFDLSTIKSYKVHQNK